MTYAGVKEKPLLCSAELAGTTGTSVLDGVPGRCKREEVMNESIKTSITDITPSPHLHMKDV